MKHSIGSFSTTTTTTKTDFRSCEELKYERSKVMSAPRGLLCHLWAEEGLTSPLKENLHPACRQKGWGKLNCFQPWIIVTSKGTCFQAVYSTFPPCLGWVCFGQGKEGGRWVDRQFHIAMFPTGWLLTRKWRKPGRKLLHSVSFHVFLPITEYLSILWSKDVPLQTVLELLGGGLWLQGLCGALGVWIVILEQWNGRGGL